MQVFSCEIFKNTCLEKQLWTAASWIFWNDFRHFVTTGIT